jgi:DeoR family transcriptional regulator, aga operon transcriptional repressor
LDSTTRRHEIVQLALAGGRVGVGDLAARFAVSEVTIRADLRHLQGRGILSRTHGGAVANTRVARELSLVEKVEDHADAKQALAEAACDLIRSGDTIILDSGTTTAQIASRLGRHDRLTVLTNGLNVALHLAHHPGVQLVMTGGRFRAQSQSFFGPHAEESLSRYNFDKLFLGVDGIDFRAGLTTHFEREAVLNRRMCKAAAEIIVVADSSKFNRAGLHRICGLSDIGTIVTDAGIPAPFADAFAQAGVRLITVEIR